METQNDLRTRCWQIVCSDVRSGLKCIKAESVHTVVTSPPYLSHRKYKTTAQEWGGDVTCRHRWNSKNFCVKKCGAWRGELGNEPGPSLYIDHLVEAFSHVTRVMRQDATLWLNIGDTYCTGSPERKAEDALGDKSYFGELKVGDLMGIPWVLASQLRKAGLWLRSEIVWAKGVSGQKETLSQIEKKFYEKSGKDEAFMKRVREVLAEIDQYVGNAMPEPVTDRPARAHESMFLLTKSRKYYYDCEAVREDAAQPDRKRADRFGGTKYGKVWHGEGSIYKGGNKRHRRDVWGVLPSLLKESHIAPFPEELVRPCIIAGTSSYGCCYRCEAPIGWAGHECGHNSSIERCLVLDPFAGSGTTGVVAMAEGRSFIGIELDPDSAKLASKRIVAAEEANNDCNS